MRERGRREEARETWQRLRARWRPRLEEAVPPSLHYRRLDEDSVHTRGLPGSKVCGASSTRDMRPTSVVNDRPSGSQTLHFQSSEENSCMIYGQDVTVSPSPSTHSSGSSKVNLKNIVDFVWDHKYTSGTIISVHISGTYLAYGIKVSAVGKSSTQGVVRVVNRRTEERALLKGMQGTVMDLAFAHMLSEVLLAIVDELGNLFVYRVEDLPTRKLLCTPVLQINQPEPGVVSENRRVIWCPWIPDDGSEDESSSIGDKSISGSMGDGSTVSGGVLQSSDDVSQVGETRSPSPAVENGKGSERLDTDRGARSPSILQLLAVTQRNRADLWHVPAVVRRYGPGPHPAAEITTGLSRIAEHQGDLVDAAFSPDGTAIATASLDGEVKFFQVYMHNDGQARCLHEWQPHAGKPVSSLFFLDNHQTHTPEAQFWKFAVTGAEFNTELKVWSCETWKCLQTLRFTKVGEDQDEDGEEGQSQKRRQRCMKAHLDLGSGYLLLSDVFQRALYVLQLQKDPQEQWACFRTITQLLLPNPIISFAIVDAGLRRLKSNYSTFNDAVPGDEEAIDEEDTSTERVVIRMYLVQPKSLQECHVVYEPPFLPSPTSPPSSPSPPTLLSPPPVVTVGGGAGGAATSHNDSSLGFREGFSDISGGLPGIDKDSSKEGGGNGERENEDEQQSAPEKGSPASSSSLTQTIPPHLNLMTPDAFSSPGKKGVLSTPNGRSASTDISFSQVSGSLGGGSILETSLTGSPAMPIPITLPMPIPISPPVPLPMSIPISPPVPLPMSKGSPGTAAHGRDKTAIDTLTSGGSSPSREVEEILGPGKTGITVVEHLKEEAADAVAPKMDSSLPKFAGKSAPVSLGGFPSPPLPPNTVPSTPPSAPPLSIGTTEEKPLTSTPPSWPQIPKDLQALQMPAASCGGLLSANREESVVTASSKEDSTTIKENILKRSPSPLINLEVEEGTLLSASQPQTRVEAQTQTPTPSHKWSEEEVKDRLAGVEQSLQKALQLLQTQQVELQELRLTLHNLQDGRNRAGNEILQQVDRHLGRQTAALRSLQESLQSLQASEPQRREALANALGPRLEEGLLARVSASLLPSLRGSLDGVGQKLQVQLEEGLSSCSQHVRDQVGKQLHAKTLAEGLQVFLAPGLSAALQEAHCRALSGTLLPSFDKALQQAFLQVNDAFAKGTREYMHMLEVQADKLQKQHERNRDPVAAQLQVLAERQERLETQLQTRLREELVQGVRSEVQAALTGWNEGVGRMVRERVAEELRRGFREQQLALENSVAAAVRSRAVTPAPSHAPGTPSAADQQAIQQQLQQQQLLQLLGQGQVNAAFQQALSASDLTLVMFLCERLDPRQIFAPSGSSGAAGATCPLQQPVLLSLVQQLSADLASNTNLKYRYLEEAVVNLDMDHPVTREHAPVVLQGLQTQLRAFLTASPGHKLARCLRMLLMAAGSFTQTLP